MAVIAVTVVVSLSAAACRTGERLPDKSSGEYREAVSAFYVGLAAMQTGENGRAEQKLTRVTEIVPGEPASWINLGLLALRQREFDIAQQRLERARALAPDNGDVYALLGLLESNRGNFAGAISHLRRSTELAPNNLKTIYALAQEIERQAGLEADLEAERLVEKVADAQPRNLAALIELARIAAKRGDREALARAVARLAELSQSWPQEVREQLSALQTAAAGPDPRQAASRIAFLRNVLVRVPDYREGLAALKLPPGEVGEPVTRFIKLPPPSPSPAAADDGLAFVSEPVSDATGWAWAGAIFLTADAQPALVLANGREVRITGGLTGKSPLSFPGGAAAVSPGADGVLALDFNYDFRNDIALAGAGGLKLFRQEESGVFTDVTARAALAPQVTGRAYFGAWAADIDLEGDLDIVLAPREGPPLVIRNNGDGTFKEVRPFEGVSGLRGFCWADLDGDGDPDAALLDGNGRIQFFTNERSGQFSPRAVPQRPERVLAISIADINGDGVLDLITLDQAGSILRISDKSDGQDWEAEQVAEAPLALPNETGAVQPRLLVADLDNNGGLDLIAGNRVLLTDAEGRFQPPSDPLEAAIISAADLSGDGRLDLVGVSGAGTPVRLMNRGTKNYHWQNVRARAATSTGDQRINSFGIGGEMEMRSSLQFQKQLIITPVTHFGLGEHDAADLVRIVWPNGTVQGEYDLAADQAVLAEQRLKGSCPWVFAHDGSRVRFVTDFIWRSPLGLRINAQDTANVAMTEEWIKIRGDQLGAVDGFYDVRITAELWETHFFDHVSLMAIDHPAGTEVFVDERFAVPPPPLIVHTTGRPRPVARAVSDDGRDVTDIVLSRDEKYLDNFGRGAYQGVTRDHWVEVELGEVGLGEQAPVDNSSWLIASGWIHPTDSSVNVALSQGAHPPPQGLVLEVADGRGGWVVAKPNLGFPAGKSKTIMISLDGVFRPGAPKRLRLRTNLEIYWDAIWWAEARPSTDAKVRRISAETAELRYRGFSAVAQADKSSPELPDYSRLAGTVQRWRDLVGYHTRFGDVRELIEKVDDRYVIMNAGDEMMLRFAALPPPAEGWTRDFVLVGDGWEKDGDYNTTFSKTVLPLPSHDRPDYTTPPGRLEDDPVYLRHARDWQDYHTRYVTPERFQKVLKAKKE